MSSFMDFPKARDGLLARRADFDTAAFDFRWPQLFEFNRALDHFDVMAAGNTQPAL